MWLTIRKFSVSICCLAAFIMPLGCQTLSWAASTHVPVGSWVYPALERLEAEGLLKSGILTSRPIGRAEAARLTSLAGAKGGASVAAARLIQRLEKEFSSEISGQSGTYLRALEANARYLYADGDPYLFNINNMGDTLSKGSNYRAGVSAAGGAGGLSSFYLNAETRYPEGGQDGESEAVIVEGYAALELWNMELTAGRQALWWGPGHHGALLLSDNARPFDMIKFTNPAPTSLPWVLRYLGPIKLTAFTTVLEEDRDFANPYLAGIRLDLKPHPNVNIGLARTAIFGGAGRHVDLGVIWDVVTAQTENYADEPGNQLGSVDLKVVLPFDVQKIVLYGELGGEDEAGSLPSRVAYILGAYLPGVLGCAPLDLRVEYGQTYIGKYPGVWYEHHLYTTGYTYDGRVIGHHMGTDARDLFVSAAYASGYGDFEVSFDIETTGRSDVKTKRRSAAVSWRHYLGETAELALSYVHDRGDSIGGVDGQDTEANSFAGSLRLDF